ncbi:MAG: tannase/feruloyl esterase family alpha/beta hydrolase [Chloroflexi bacterium]|nr:tannase/feruloyl esterase family alpha/beta hydrolase [Chloroflexota bacterium]
MAQMKRVFGECMSLRSGTWVIRATGLLAGLALLGGAASANPRVGGAEATELAAPAAAANATIAPVLPCGALAQFPTLETRPQPGVPDFFQIPGAPTEISSATVVAGTAQAPEYCDVQGVIAPQISFELKLPTTTYEGRYMQMGCGGECGRIGSPSFPSCDLQPGGNFAVAATDDGHTGAGVWAVDDQLRLDFAYRAVHVVSVAAKAIIAAYYGAAPQHAYFNGCSEGGREGLEEAQRYPDDFNGIAAGAPASIWAPLEIFQAWEARANVDAQGHPILTPDKLPALHSAVLAACDGLDGLVDGQINDPRLCHFDPGSMVCPSGTDAPTCLTAAQVEAVRKIYSGPVDARGELLYPGGEPYGSELAWNGWMVQRAPGVPTAAESLATDYFKFMAFRTNPPASYTILDFPFTEQGFNSTLPLGELYDATNPDLRAFRDRGGKLIMWQGWADQAIPPTGTPDYYDAIQDRMGGLTATQQFARLFMFPTMYHCAGGYGPDQFDVVNPLVHWVELGQAPDKIVATETSNGQPSGSIVRTRPVFAYPEQAAYTGSGSIDDAANFVGVMPSPPPADDIKWLGQNLFKAHEE